MFFWSTPNVPRFGAISVFFRVLQHNLRSKLLYVCIHNLDVSPQNNYKHIKKYLQKWQKIMKTFESNVQMSWALYLYASSGTVNEFKVKMDIRMDILKSIPVLKTNPIMSKLTLFYIVNQPIIFESEWDLPYCSWKFREKLFYL